MTPKPAGPGSSGREWARRLAMVIGAPLLMLAALEYGFWVFDVAPPPTNAVALDTPAPGIIQNGWTESAFNAKMQSVPSNGRVLCLGGSSMAGAPLDHELTMCHMAAEALDPPAEVHNLGLSALASRDVRVLATAACKHKQRLILMYFGHNEFLNLKNFVRSKPPQTLIDASSLLERFRFYRWIQDLVATSSAVPSESGEAEITNSEVFERYEENLRAIMDACRDQPIIIATVISNQALRSARAQTVQKAHRTGTLKPVGLHDACRECFRAPEIINLTISKVAAEFGVPLVRMEPLLDGVAPNDVFWDHVHPKPELLKQMARKFLEAAKAAEFIESFREPTYTVTPEKLRWAAATRARFNLRLDPVTALEQLEASRGHLTPLDDSVTLAVASFLLDKRDLMAKHLQEANRVIAGDATVAETVRQCANEKRHTCVTINSAQLMDEAERTELLQQAESAGASPELLTLLRVL